MGVPPDVSGDLGAVALTLELAAASVAILFLLGTPLAWWLAHELPGGSRVAALVSTVVALPLVLPPTVLGFYLLLLLGPGGPVGAVTDALGIGTLAFTFPGLVIASVLYTLPFVVQPLQVAFARLPAGMLEAAATLRATPRDRFLRLAVPASTSAFVTAGILGFAHVLGEFGIVLMIGGNIPGSTRVVSIAIFDHVEALEFGNAHVLAGGLVGFSVVAIFLLQRLGLPLAHSAAPLFRPSSRSSSQPSSQAPTQLALPSQPSSPPWLHARLHLSRPDFTLDAAFTLPATGVTALIGPSGSGKTTILRCLAGLEPCATGQITAGTETWLDSSNRRFLLPHLRGAAVVFQEPRLFSHLDVQANLGFASSRADAGEGGVPIEEIIDLLRLAPLLNRAVDGLSRGEAQRVALARALASRPRLLLLDEPISGLDETRKSELLPQLSRLLGRLAIPVLYVSHDHAETERIAETVIALSGGRIDMRTGAAG
jgi:molybdate transport system permease protein